MKKNTDDPKTKRKIKRAANGDGSIYQRKDGRWCAAVTIGYSNNGTQIRKSIYDKDREQLRAKLLALQNDIIKYVVATDCIITVKGCWSHSIFYEII